VHHARVVTEMNRLRMHALQPSQRIRPRFPIAVLAGPDRQIRLIGLAVDFRGVRGVADHHDPAIWSVDKDALMSDRVAGSRDHSHTVCNLRVAVNQEMAQPTTPVKPGDEIAFFPPVTGG